MRELIHPVTGARRVWPENGRSLTVAGTAALQAAPVEAQRPYRVSPQVTEARIENHAVGMLFSPIKPTTARNILDLALQGELYQQWELFTAMEEWDRLSKCLNEVKNAVKRLSWNVAPYIEPGAEKPSDSALEKARLVESALKNWEPEPDTLETSFEGFIYDAMDAMGKGISIQEIHWYQRDGVWMPRAAHLLTPRQYGWNPGGTRLGLFTGAASGITAFGPPDRGMIRVNWAQFPENQFVVGQWKARSGIPGATALLRPLVPYWMGITYGWRWLMQTAQLFGVPFRWATYDETEPGLADKIAAMLEAMGSSGFGVFPAGTTLDFKEAITSARDNPQALILELANTACDLLILGQELSSESKSTGLGSGNALLQGKVRQDVLHHAAAWVAELINYQLVLAILQLNYGEKSEAPCVTADFSVDPDPVQMANRDKVLSDLGMNLPAEWLYERHGVPQPEDGEAVVTPRPIAGPQGAAAGGADETALEKEMSAASQPRLRAELKATDATEKLIDHTLENLTGVQAKWLGGVKPVFRKMLLAAKDEKLSDADFIAELKAVQKSWPELFGKLDHDALAKALEGAMGAACVNGAVRGFLQRREGAKEDATKFATKTADKGGGA